MNKKFTLKKIIAHTHLILILAIAIVFVSCSSVESMAHSDINKTYFNKKERAVKIYPDMIKRVMHVKSIEVTPLDLFVFDLDGTLIKHFKMIEGDHRKIAGLVRGEYVYQVFKGDEMSESGKLKIK